MFYAEHLLPYPLDLFIFKLGASGKDLGQAFVYGHPEPILSKAQRNLRKNYGRDK